LRLRNAHHPTLDAGLALQYYGQPVRIEIVHLPSQTPPVGVVPIQSPPERLVCPMATRHSPLEWACLWIAALPVWFVATHWARVGHSSCDEGVQPRAEFLRPGRFSCGCGNAHSTSQMRPESAQPTQSDRTDGGKTRPWSPFLPAWPDGTPATHPGVAGRLQRKLVVGGRGSGTDQVKSIEVPGSL
jgi:hypothetical protein